MKDTGYKLIKEEIPNRRFRDREGRQASDGCSRRQRKVEWGRMRRGDPQGSSREMNKQEVRYFLHVMIHNIEEFLFVYIIKVSIMILTKGDAWPV